MPYNSENNKGQKRGFDFNEKIAVVTGASRGIGKAIATKLENYNCEVIKLSSRDIDFLDKNIEQKIKDFADKIEILDILINNAGINIIENIDESNPESFKKVLQVNLYAPYLMSTILSKKIRDNGRIVNISSIYSVVGAEGRLHYMTAKAGLNGLTRNLAIELGKRNILVNSVSPGYTMTDLTIRCLGEDGIKEKSKLIPIGRLAKPEEIANLVVFLVSDFNTYITGQNIIIDGGYTII